MPDGEEGLLAFRLESMLTWGEYVKVDRTADDDPDENAEAAADGMEQLSVARDASPVSKRLRFDLDMPSAEYDDVTLDGGALLPEWDYRKASYLADHCRIVPMLARDAIACDLPPTLRRTAKRLRGQFQALAQTRVWQRGAQQGDPDIDAYLRFATDRAHGHVAPEAALYRELRTGARDLACLLLADLSLSTDASVNDDARVIDVVRDTLFLFGEALAAAGDRFALYGFSSRRREHVRFNLIKAFDERYDAGTRGRIAAIKPGYYTRMGAAVRHATALLAAQPATRQLLLIVTDGKPNDLDCYEGRYGVEDTRLAIIEARRRGLYPYCVTIDREAGDYLPHLFGPGHYCVIRHPEELPSRLPQLYARLTA
jgi:nitric oxide reductase NorD protein